jgi:PAS domain S-box-containing protein
MAGLGKQGGRPGRLRMGPVEPLEVSLKAFADCIPEPIVLLDDRGNVVFFNLCAETTFGYTNEETHGRSFAALLLAEDQQGIWAARMRDLLRDADPSGARTSIDLAGRCKDGRALSLRLTACVQEFNERRALTVHVRAGRQVRRRRPQTPKR